MNQNEEADLLDETGALISTMGKIECSPAVERKNSL